MGKFNYRDTRAKCEIFYLKNPELAKDPCAHPNPDVVVVKEFKVSSYKEAEDLVDEFNRNDLAHTYYWRYKHDKSDFGLWHSDGVCSFGLNDVDEWFVSRIVKHRIAYRELLKEEKPNPLNTIGELIFSMKKKEIVGRIGRIRRLSRCRFLRGLVQAWISTCDWCRWWLKDKWIGIFNGLMWDRKNLRYWKKNHHSIDEYWSIEMHMLGDLKWNLKRLIEEGYTINTEFVKDVMAEKARNDPSFNEDAAWDGYMSGSDNGNIEEEAVRRQKETYARIAHLVDLYSFYVWQQIDDEDAFTSPNRTPDMQPIIRKGTYDMLDYPGMTKRANEVWNEIWDLMKRYGQQMSD